MIVAVETFLKKDIDFSEITDWHEVTTTAGLINHIYKFLNNRFFTTTALSMKYNIRNFMT